MRGFATVRAKFLLIGLALLIPQLFQASVIWKRAATEIAFSAKEQVGTAYLAALYPVHLALDAAIAQGRMPDDMPARLERLSKAGEAHDGTLETAARHRQVHQMLASEQAQNGLRQSDEALGALLGQIGDKSNLILDPDLDTYYLMTLVVERLPEMSRLAARLAESHRQAGADAAARQQVLDDLVTGLANLETARRKVAAAAGLVRTHAANRDLGERIVAGSVKLGEAATRLAAEVELGRGQLRASGGANLALPALGETIGAFQEQTGHFYKEALAALDQLLAVRIAGHERSRNTDLLMVLAIGLAAYMVGFFLIRRVLKGLWFLRLEIDRMATGDLHAENGKAWTSRPDEIGAIARAVERLRQSVIARLTDAFSSEKEAAIRHEQSRAIAGIAHQLDSGVTRAVKLIHSLSSELRQSVAFVEQSATRTGAAVADSVNSLRETSLRATGAASGLQELSHATTEIASQTGHVADAVKTARSQAARSADQAVELGEMLKEINGIGTYVETIARQINLLALNATIEAARAGSAGRGFAVVASEVKLLAQQTSNATTEIAQKVESIASVVHAVRDSMRGVVQAVEAADEIALSIAAAVEQHDVTTNEINQRIQDTVTESATVSARIADVAEMALTTQEISQTLDQLSVSLAQEAGALRAEMDNFLNGIAVAA